MAYVFLLYVRFFLLRQSEQRLRIPQGRSVYEKLHRLKISTRVCPALFSFKGENFKRLRSNSTQFLLGIGFIIDLKQTWNNSLACVTIVTCPNTNVTHTPVKVSDSSGTLFVMTAVFYYNGQIIIIMWSQRVRFIGLTYIHNLLW